MKKNMSFLVPGLLFLGMIVFALVPNALFAQQAVPIGQMINKNLSATGTPVVAIKPVDTLEITQTSAQLDFTLRALKNTPAVITGIITDPAGVKIREQVIFANNILSVNEQADFTYPSVTGLIPGTTYTIQLTETVGGPATYQALTFTTAGDSPAETTEPLSVQKNSITITFPNTSAAPNPKLTLFPTSVRDTYDATFSGEFTTSLNMRVQLQLFVGESSGSLSARAVPFPEKLVQRNTPQTFSYTVPLLLPGTTYYYQVKETRTGFLTPVYSFVTPGTRPAEIVPFDADAPGLLDNYEFPENIGEPTGDGTGAVTDTGEPLVPCGKSTDAGTDYENCKLEHVVLLVQNVINFLLILLIPLTVLVCVYTGVQMIIHRKIPADLVKYKENFKRIGIGVALMLLAFTIVSTIIQTLLPAGSTGFSLLNILG